MQPRPALDQPEQHGGPPRKEGVNERVDETDEVGGSGGGEVAGGGERDKADDEAEGGVARGDGGEDVGDAASGRGGCMGGHRPITRGMVHNTHAVRMQNPRVSSPLATLASARYMPPPALRPLPPQLAPHEPRDGSLQDVLRPPAPLRQQLSPDAAVTELFPRFVQLRVLAIARLRRFKRKRSVTRTAQARNSGWKNTERETVMPLRAPFPVRKPR